MLVVYSLRAMRKPLLLLSIVLFASGVRAESNIAPHSITTARNTVCILQSDFGINLNLFLRAEARRHSGGIPLELSRGALKHTSQRNGNQRAVRFAIVCSL